MWTALCGVSASHSSCGVESIGLAGLSLQTVNAEVLVAVALWKLATHLSCPGEAKFTLEMLRALSAE